MLCRRVDGASPKQRNARSDFPDPDEPRMSTPRLPTAIAVAWTRSVSSGKPCSCIPCQRKADSEARAACGVRAVLLPVLGEDFAIVTDDDLFRDRKPEARVLAAFVIGLGAIAVEPVEDLRELVGRDSRALIFDHDFDCAT